MAASIHEILLGLGHLNVGQRDGAVLDVGPQPTLIDGNDVRKLENKFIVDLQFISGGSHDNAQHNLGSDGGVKYALRKWCELRQHGRKTPAS